MQLQKQTENENIHYTVHHGTARINRDLFISFIKTEKFSVSDLFKMNFVPGFDFLPVSLYVDTLVCDGDG